MADRPRRSESERERLRRISILNARLPKKRTIAQGVLRNPAGEVLLCELSYKKEWDLPGGVVDPGESPATCVEFHTSRGLMSWPTFSSSCRLCCQIRNAVLPGSHSHRSTRFERNDS